MNLAAASSRRSRLSIIDTLSMPLALHDFRRGIVIWMVEFFFFFLFIQGWREDVIFYSFWDIWGIEKGLSFFGRGFFETWNYSAWYFFFFFLFFSEDFIFICTALDILMKSDHRRIDIMFVSVWIFMSLIFFFFFHFFFLLSFFIGLCDLLMLFIHGPCSIGYVKYVYSS